MQDTWRVQVIVQYRPSLRSASSKNVSGSALCFVFLTLASFGCMKRERQYVRTSLGDIYFRLGFSLGFYCMLLFVHLFPCCFLSTSLYFCSRNQICVNRSTIIVGHIVLNAKKWRTILDITVGHIMLNAKKWRAILDVSLASVLAYVKYGQMRNLDFWKGGKIIRFSPFQKTR